MRKRAFQLKYALSLGLRPSALDPRTHEVLAVQCAFCVAFGREPRAVQDAEDEDAGEGDGDGPDGEAAAAPAARTRRPPRARTSNVRSWAPPIRPDNIRLHMRAQHPMRFSAYAALVARAKQDGSFQAAAGLGVATLFPALATGSGELSGVAVSPAVTGAARELLTFFGDVLLTPAPAAPAVHAAAGGSDAAAAAEALLPHEVGTAARKRKEAKAKNVPALLAKRVAVPAVLTELVESLVCLADESPALAVAGAEDDDEDELLATRAGGTKRRRKQQGGRGDAQTDEPNGEDVLERNSRLTIRRVRPDPDASAGSRAAAAREELEVDVKSSEELAKTQRLLAEGLSFEQTARVLGLLGVGAPLSAATVASYARVSVVSALDRIAELMRRSWTFALVLDVGRRVPASPNALSAAQDGVGVSPSPLYRAVDVCMRLPTAGIDGSNDAMAVHVVALPLLPFEHSLERTLAFLTRFLDVLDPSWTRKLLGCVVNGDGVVAGDADASFSAALLAQRVAHHARSNSSSNSSATPDLSPFYQPWQPAQLLTGAMQRALGEIKGAIIVNGVRVDTGFGRSLASVTAFLRGQEAWMRTHGRCPALDARCPWSMLAATQWLLARREAVNELYANTSQLRSTVYPSAIFWLILFAVADVLTAFEHVRRALEAFPTPSGHESRRQLAECVRMLMDKTGVVRLGFAGMSDDAADGDFVFGENVSRLGRFEWQREPALVRYVRSLNLSSRRLYTDTSAANQGRAEFGITCFMLRVVHSVSRLALGSEDVLGADAATLEAPPVLPLQFIELDRSRVVDLIDQHSARLDKAFGSRFLDRISSDIERLRTLVGTASRPQASPFRRQLEDAQTRSFRDAWALLVPHGMASLRRFAAGLATVLPRTDNAARAELAVHFPAGEEDQFRSNFADLAIEAKLHCAQARRLTVDAHTQ